MDVTAILDGLTYYERLPVTAIRAARDNRPAVLAAFLKAVDDYVNGDTAVRATASPLLLAFHMLGEWRETLAYRPLARLLASPPMDIDRLLGDAITGTTHRVMEAVFDGDPGPLYALILDPEADEFVRSRMCEVIAMLAIRGSLPREEAARFLAVAFHELQPDQNCAVWDGWQNAIALLGLEELRPLVRQAFESGAIDPMSTGFDDFERALAYAQENRDQPHYNWAGEYAPFGDTIAELSTWYGFSERAERDRKRRARDAERAYLMGRSALDPAEPAVNVYKGIGRNDPCPCGSGLKYKKCCLN
jgi:hypothetical protein